MSVASTNSYYGFSASSNCTLCAEFAERQENDTTNSETDTNESDIIDHDWICVNVTPSVDMIKNQLIQLAENQISGPHVSTYIDYSKTRYEFIINGKTYMNDIDFDEFGSDINDSGQMIELKTFDIKATMNSVYSEENIYTGEERYPLDITVSKDYMNVTATYRRN